MSWTELFGARNCIQTRDLFFEQAGRKFFTTAALMAGVFGAVSLMATNVKAQKVTYPLSPAQQDAYNLYQREDQVAQVYITWLRSTLRIEKCLDQKTIDQLQTGAADLRDELVAVKSNPALPENVDRFGPRVGDIGIEMPPFEIDKLIKQLDSLIFQIGRKPVCPPPYQPIILHCVGTGYKLLPENGRIEIGGLNRPCIVPNPGAHFGFETQKNSGLMNWTETFAATGQITDQGSVSHDPLGVGLNIGYGFAPWGNGFIVDPFVSFDYLGWSINQTFPGGSSLGTRSNFDVTGGVKIGPSINPSTWVYLIAGVSALNETLNINFIPLSSSITKTVPGATLGVGAAIMPGFLQGFGHPVSLSLEYQHTWWQTADYNTPAASPLFNYAFKREDDTFKLGFNVYFSATPPAAPPQSNMALKAPPSR